ncbi:MAG: MBL fold metallo-hydrolase, partial [Verrucomicrobiae bacterium]|nr:MBL fold metallo-hydrolase [Verrucomicrobiae bacterium]
FRTQALRAGLQRLDAVLLTHAHADHILGMDDLRAFTEKTDRAMPVWATPRCLEAVRRVFAYACTDRPTWVTVPRFELNPLTDAEAIRIGSLEVLPMQLPHGTVEVTGFLFSNRVAYLTDCNDVPSDVVARLRGVPVLILDGLRHRPHPTHLTIARAVELAGEIAARQTYLTHICHEVEHAAAEASLPAHVRLAYDGLELEV